MDGETSVIYEGTQKLDVSGRKVEGLDDWFLTYCPPIRLACGKGQTAAQLRAFFERELSFAHNRLRTMEDLGRHIVVHQLTFYREQVGDRDPISLVASTISLRALAILMRSSPMFDSDVIRDQWGNALRLALNTCDFIEYDEYEQTVKDNA